MLPALPLIVVASLSHCLTVAASHANAKCTLVVEKEAFTMLQSPDALSVPVLLMKHWHYGEDAGKLSNLIYDSSNCALSVTTAGTDERILSKLQARANVVLDAGVNSSRYNDARSPPVIVRDPSSTKLLCPGGSLPHSNGALDSGSSGLALLAARVVPDLSADEFEACLRSRKDLRAREINILHHG